MSPTSSHQRPASFSGRRSLHVMRTAFALVLSLASFGETPARAQEPGEEEEVNYDSRQDGLEMYYGKLKIAGRNSEEDEPAETNFGLERMYGGVTGQAGVHGKRSSGPKRGTPEIHTVQKGDTLWDLSSKYYGNPWSWPQVWGLNPQIENPHWIYPGDQVRTRRGVQKQMEQRDDNSTGGGGFIGGGKLVPNGTVFIRDQGYIGDPERDVWGEVVGSFEDQMLLTDGDTIYLSMREGTDLRLGQRLTIFEPIADPPHVPDARKPPGKIVKIYGTVRVDGWDRDTRVAKGTLIESLDSIERGFSVGPVGRRFDVVPPKPAEADIDARVITSLHPHIFFGQNQLLFIDQGSEDGVSAGNRLRIVRRGDTWEQNLVTSNVHARMRVEMGSPDVPKGKTTPLHGDDDDFPDEVVGEIQVLRTEEYSAICIVTESAVGLKPGDRAVAVKGY